VKRNERVLILKEREVKEVLETIESLIKHVQTLLRDIKYLEVNS